MVKQRGKTGVWYARVETKDEQNRRVQKWVSLPDCKTRGEAIVAEEKLKEQVEKTGEIAADPKRQTVAEFLKTWLENRAKISPKTRQTYRSWIDNQLIPILGHHQLGDLEAHHIQSAYRKMGKSGSKRGKGGLTPQSILHCHRILKVALGSAVKQRILTWNPADGAEPPSVDRKEMLALDERQVNRLLYLVTGTRLDLPVRLAVFCGLRRGEVLALRWGDVDFKEGTLAVRRSLEQTTGKNGSLRFKSPKTGRSRVVALPPSLLDVLRRHKGEQSHELLICQPDGSPWSPNALTSAFIDFMAKIDMPKIRFHDLRHTSATLYLKQGVPVKVVSERLGHSTTKLTLDVYGHVLKGMDMEAAHGFDAALLAAGEDWQG